MGTEAVVAGARAVWVELAGVAGQFPASGVRVAVSPRSRRCPAGWVGGVSLGGAVLVTVPTGRAAALVRAALRQVPLEAVTAVLPVRRVLGPAALAYLDGRDFRPVLGDTDLMVRQFRVGHPDLLALEAAAGEEDAGEAGLGEVTSPVFAVHDGRTVAAAAGYGIWAGRAAHVGVLTAPARRGRGLARVAGTAAVAHALAADLLPQWRARVPASRRAAAALGFRELGLQFSF